MLLTAVPARVIAATERDAPAAESGLRHLCVAGNGGSGSDVAALVAAALTSASIAIRDESSSTEAATRRVASRLIECVCSSHAASRRPIPRLRPSCLAASQARRTGQRTHRGGRCAADPARAGQRPRGPLNAQRVPPTQHPRLGGRAGRCAEGSVRQRRMGGDGGRAHGRQCRGAREHSACGRQRTGACRQLRTSVRSPDVDATPRCDVCGPATRRQHARQDTRAAGEVEWRFCGGGHDTSCTRFRRHR